MKDSFLLADVELTKYCFIFYGEELYLYLTKDEFEPIDYFFTLINSSDYTWQESCEIVCQSSPNVYYILNSLKDQESLKIRLIDRNLKIKQIIN